jgi:GST-like protein
MIDIYFWPTGNGKKITIMLEECGLPYNVIPVNINTVFESGAILQYLGEKTGKLLPTDIAGRYRVKIEYPMHRFRTEVTRLYEVMDKQLARNEYLAGDYSIADIAAWPWVVRHDWQGQDLNDTPHVKRWFEAVGARPTS